MPDFTMCVNDECPSKSSCYRFVATPGPHSQAWERFGFNPNTGKCNRYTLATCCEQSHHQWGSGEYSGEWHPCLYCGVDWVWREDEGQWHRTGND